jgi:uncharacterized iron-regulated membrane protein
MRFSHFNRKLHYWVGICIALPTLVIVTTGLLLQLKKHWSWVQPTELRGTGDEPRIGFHELLAAVQSRPELGVRGWQDVNRIDVRPGRAVAKVWLHSGTEVQVDIGNGDVLSSAYRRSDLIESIHDGSWFGGNWTKLGLFLPTCIGLLVLCMSGIWLFWQPFAVRRRQRRALARNDGLPGR